MPCLASCWSSLRVARRRPRYATRATFIVVVDARARVTTRTLGLADDATRRAVSFHHERIDLVRRSTNDNRTLPSIARGVPSARRCPARDGFHHPVARVGGDRGRGHRPRGHQGRPEGELRRLRCARAASSLVFFLLFSRPLRLAAVLTLVHPNPSSSPSPTPSRPRPRPRPQPRAAT